MVVATCNLLPTKKDRLFPSNIQHMNPGSNWGISTSFMGHIARQGPQAIEKHSSSPSLPLSSLWLGSITFLRLSTPHSQQLNVEVPCCVIGVASSTVWCMTHFGCPSFFFFFSLQKRAICYTSRAQKSLLLFDCWRIILFLLGRKQQIKRGFHPRKHIQYESNC